MFLSTWNARRIYEEGRKITLMKTKFSLFVHQGATEKNIGVLIASLCSIIYILVIAGGFSINGFSQDMFVPISAPVRIGYGRNVIDYTEHISEDGSLVSGTFLAARDVTTCIEFGKDYVKLYSGVNDLVDVNAVKWPTETFLGNSTCLYLESGYKDDYNTPMQMKSMNSTSKCYLQVEVDSRIRLGKCKPFTSESCPFRVHEFWCSWNVLNVSVGQIEYDGGFTTVISYLEGSSNEVLTIPTKVMAEVKLFGEEFFDNRLNETAIRSMAHLIGSGVISYDTNQAIYLGIMSVETNVQVSKHDGTAEFTEIDVRFLGFTLGLALFLTLVMGCVTYLGWTVVNANEKVKGRNRLYSSEDMLTHAISMSRKNKHCKCGSRKTAYVRVLADCENVAISCCNENEVEIDGVAR